MRVLALEPYYGGSHRAFIDGWIEHSHHHWTLLSLPASKWKWRMRHSAVTLAAWANQLLEQGKNWDAVWASDMLPLAEFRSLVATELYELPTIFYLHENQFTYPNQVENSRDYHFAFTNYVSCLAAEQVWFNSEFHRHDFLQALANFLRRMPDYPDKDNVSKIMSKSDVQYPGIRLASSPSTTHNVPVKILWSARWEHDKNPDLFFEALRQVKSHGTTFRLNLLGRHSEQIAPVFETAAKEFGNEIDFWGYAESREEYEAVVQSSDIIVSTADHEFFGIGLVEALSAGVIPLLPHRLSYPELLAPLPDPMRKPVFYDGTLKDLTAKLVCLCNLQETKSLKRTMIELAARFRWSERAAKMDQTLEELVRKIDYRTTERPL